MANKPPPPDQNILVYVQDYDNSTLQATVNSRKNCRGYEGPRCETAAAESTCSLPMPDSDIESARNFSQEYVAPPYGWKRLHTKGIVVYVSPSNTPLSSTEQVKAYLLAEGTCKCGLECPVNCETTFNFNPKVLTRPWTAPALGPGDLNKLCNHKRKLLSQSSFESIDNKFADDFRKKKRKFGPPLPQPHLPHNESGFKDPEHTTYNGLPWRDSNQEFSQESYTNGYQLKYEVCGNPQYQKIQGASRFGPPNPMPPQQVNYEQRVSSYGSTSYEAKYKSNQSVEYIHSQEIQQQQQPPAPVHAVPTGLNVNRTPPWQQNKTQPNTFERIPTFPQHNPTSTVWNNDLKKKQTKFIRKRYSDDNINPSTPEPPPSFMEDPSGYLAQQTALLNSTISRQSSPAVDGVPLPSSLNKYPSRPKCKSIITSRFPDSSVERRKPEEPSSTLPDKNIDDRGPIQGTTVSTSNRSPVEVRPPENVVTTMASGHTASSNTITSVLAGKANTATVSVSNPGIQQKPQQNEEGGVQQDDVRQILVPSPGQLVVANSVLPGQSKPVINQPTVLLPGPLLLQPSVVVDSLNTTLQIPQIVGNVVQNQVIDDTALLSPESKRKANLKKRKLSPTIGSMLLSPQGSNNVMVQQQQLNAPMLQALTILPGKTGFTGTQQLITTNMLQPLNLVQNFPIQQFIVPTGVGSMVMSDGTILQDTVQLNLLTPVQNTNVFSNGQNLLTPGMVIRTPSSQSSGKVIQNNQFLNSPNQFVVNNAFTGPVSPLLNVSPTQCNRSQDFLSQNVVVQQPSTSNTTVVQQNTTIVQQTTMVSNQQTQPTPTLNLNQNFILNDKPNFILTSEKQNFILSPNNDKIIINPENMRANFVLGNVDKQNFVINNMEKQQNLIINNYEKNYIVDKKNSVSTQTQVASPGLYRESPPDTTTLSPIDQEVTTSLQPTSPQESLPMVHCVSSSSHHDDQSFSVENYLGHMGKTIPFSDASCITVQTSHSKENEYKRKMSLCEVPENAELPDGETVSMFPSLCGHIYGEENNQFVTDGETITVEVKPTAEETANLLNKVIGNLAASNTLSEALYSPVNISNEITNKLPPLPNNLGVWIDPIDSTAEYIHGGLNMEHGFIISGLPCVTVLLGVFDKDTGIPLIGVINQPFYKEESNGRWSGRYIFGISYNGFKLSYPPSELINPKVIAVSSSEKEDIKETLKQGGYELVEIAGAGFKLLNIILGQVCAYVLSKPTSYLWDICGCHAVLESIGGGIVNFTNLSSIIYKGKEEVNCCNSGGIIAYRNADIRDDIIELLKSLRSCESSQDDMN